MVIGKRNKLVKFLRGNNAESNIPVKPGVFNRVKNITNQKFGKLTAIKFLGINNHRNAVWECKCDCGNLTNCNISALRNKSKQSCGCINRQILKDRGITQRLSNDIYESKIIAIYHSYMRMAIKRNLIFELQLDEFKKLIFNNCFYCDSKPKNIQKYKDKLLFNYNGIDRMENDIGYISSNSVSCCGQCNQCKSDYDIVEFIDWIEKCYENIYTKKCNPPRIIIK